MLMLGHYGWSVLLYLWIPAHAFNQRCENKMEIQGDFFGLFELQHMGGWKGCDTMAQRCTLHKFI